VRSWSASLGPDTAYSERSVVRPGTHSGGEQTLHRGSKVDDIKVVRGLSHGLNEQAQAAARQILFLPAIKNGKFVSTRLQLEFTYNLY